MEYNICFDAAEARDPKGQAKMACGVDIGKRISSSRGSTSDY